VLPDEADRGTRQPSRRSAANRLSLAHLLTGAVGFPVIYGIEVAWVWTEFTRVAAAAFALLLVPTGLFALAWTHRMRTLAVNVGGRMASWMKLDAVARVAEARSQLLRRLDHMRERYRAEGLGRETGTHHRRSVTSPSTPIPSVSGSPPRPGRRERRTGQAGDERCGVTKPLEAAAPGWFRRGVRWRPRPALGQTRRELRREAAETRRRGEPSA
jgi:hypothetical protein